MANPIDPNQAVIDLTPADIAGVNGTSPASMPAVAAPSPAAPLMQSPAPAQAPVLAPQADSLTLVGTNGAFYDIPLERAHEAMQQGFREPTQDELHQQELKNTYGNGALPAIGATALGAARTLSFGLSDVALAKAGGGEAAEALRKYNPSATTVGEFGALLVPLLGDLGVLGSAGKVAGLPLNLVSKGAARVGAGVEGVAGSIARSAAAAAAENAVFQVGQNISDAALQDRELGAEAILANVGEAALFGGAFGAALPLGGKLTRLSLDSARQGVSKLGDSLLALTERNADNIGAAAAEGVERLANTVESVGASVAAPIGQAAESVIGGAQKVAREVVESQLPGVKRKLADATGRADIIEEAFAKPMTAEGLASREALLRSGVSRTREEAAEGFTKDLQASFDQISEAQPLLNAIKQSTQAQRLAADMPRDALVNKVLTLVDDSEKIASRVGQYSPAFETRFNEIMGEFETKVTGKTIEELAVLRQAKDFKLPISESVSPGKLFEHIDDLKKSVDGLAKFEKGVIPASSETFAVDAIREFRSGLRNALIDESLGGAAKVQLRFNELYGEHMAAQRALEDAFMLKGNASKAFGAAQKIDAKKVRSFIRDIDQPQSDTLKDIVDQYHKTSKALLDEVGTYREAFAMMEKVNPGAIKGGIDALRNRIGGAEQKLESLRVLSGAETALGQLEVQALRRADLGPALSKFAIGGLAGGKFGLAVAAAMERYGAITTNPVSALKTLTWMERMSLSSKKEIAEGVAATIRGSSKTAAEVIRKAARYEDDLATAVREGSQLGRKGVAAADAAIDRATQKAADKADRVYKQALSRVMPVVGVSSTKDNPEPSWFDRTQTKLTRMVSDPQRAADELQKELRDVYDQDPLLANRLFDLRMKQMNYLYEAMPKQPGGVYLVNNSWKPSPQSLQKFERIYRTVTEPMTIFTDVSRGTATREQVKALQTLYPRLHGDLVASVMEALEKTPNVPHAVQIKLGSLLGAPVSFSQTPAFAMALQKIAGEGQQQQSDGAPSGGPGGSLRPTKINSVSKMGESMRVANR